MKFIRFTLAAIACLSLTGCWITSTGEKIGRVTKLARVGPFCPTWEGEIVRGELSDGTGVMGAPFHFTVEGDALAKQVEDAMNKRQEVKVTYKTEAVTFCRSDSNNHFLTKLETLSTGNISVPQVQTEKPNGATTPIDRQKIADAIVQQNSEVLRKNQQLIDLLKKQH